MNTSSTSQLKAWHKRSHRFQLWISRVVIDVTFRAQFRYYSQWVPVSEAEEAKWRANTSHHRRMWNQHNTDMFGNILIFKIFFLSVQISDTLAEVYWDWGSLHVHHLVFKIESKVTFLLYWLYQAKVMLPVLVYYRTFWRRDWSTSGHVLSFKMMILSVLK